MPRKIAYYITAHGHGHAVRSTYLINSLGKSCEITILSDIPRIFFESELSVPFSYRSAIFDCGCVQHDALKIDVNATIAEYSRIAAINDESLADEVLWIHENHIELIVSDMVSFAGVIGNKAGIPSVSVSNFWWDDIYRDFPDSIGKQWLVRRVEGEMAHFSHHVMLSPSMKKWEGSENILTGVNLLREARNRSQELREMLELDASAKIALIYTGKYGMNLVDWSKLEQYTGWHFIGLYPLPNEPRNFTQISKVRFTMQEFTASVDVVISKLGYGTVMESLASGTPILYMPREEFAEFPVLESYLKRFGHALRIEDDQFMMIGWKDRLEELYNGGKRLIRLSSDANMISDWILAIPRT